MCIKIVSSEKESEFNMYQPLSEQVVDASHVLVKYDSENPKIDRFLDQMELMVKNGVSGKFDITVDPQNTLDGYRFRAKVKKMKFQLDVNEAIKKLVTIHAETDKKVSEIAERCLGIK